MLQFKNYLENKVESIPEEFKKLYDIIEKNDYYEIDHGNYLIPVCAVIAVSESHYDYEIQTRGAIISLSKEEKKIVTLVRMV